MNTENTNTEQNATGFNKERLKRRITEFVVGGTAATLAGVGYVVGYVNRSKPKNVTDTNNVIDDRRDKDQVEDLQSSINITGRSVSDTRAIDEFTDERMPIDNQEWVVDEKEVTLHPTLSQSEESITEDIRTTEIANSDLNLQYFFEHNNFTPIAHQQVIANGVLIDVVFLKNNYGQNYAMIDCDGNGYFDIIINSDYMIVAAMHDFYWQDLAYSVEDVLAYLHDMIDEHSEIANDYIDDPSDDVLVDNMDPASNEHNFVNDGISEFDEDQPPQNDTLQSNDYPYDESDVEENFDDEPNDEIDVEDNFGEESDTNCSGMDSNGDLCDDYTNNLIDHLLDEV